MWKTARGPWTPKGALRQQRQPPRQCAAPAPRPAPPAPARPPERRTTEACWLHWARRSGVGSGEAERCTSDQGPHTCASSRPRRPPCTVRRANSPCTHVKALGGRAGAKAAGAAAPVGGSARRAEEGGPGGAQRRYTWRKHVRPAEVRRERTAWWCVALRTDRCSTARHNYGPTSSRSLRATVPGCLPPNVRRDLRDPVNHAAECDAVPRTQLNSTEPTPCCEGWCALPLAQK